MSGRAAAIAVPANKHAAQFHIALFMGERPILWETQDQLAPVARVPCTVAYGSLSNTISLFVRHFMSPVQVESRSICEMRYVVNIANDPFLCRLDQGQVPDLAREQQRALTSKSMLQVCMHASAQTKRATRDLMVRMPLARVTETSFSCTPGNLPRRVVTLSGHAYPHSSAAIVCDLITEMEVWRWRMAHDKDDLWRNFPRTALVFERRFGGGLSRSLGRGALGW
jgi:hypothetical protein